MSGIVVPDWFDNDSLRVAYLYTEGVRTAAEGGEATEYFRAALAIDSLHAPSLYQLAEEEMQSSPQKAFEHGLAAYNSDTTNLDYQSLLAYLYVLNQKYQTAQQAYNRLLAKDPRNPFNYRMAAALYSASGMPFAAISVLDSAEYKLGRIDELVQYKRELLTSVKLYSRAIEETEASVRANPFDNDNYRILGELYGLTGKDSLASANYSKAMQLDSTNLQTLLSLGNYYKIRGREAEYMGVLQRIFVLDGVDLKTKLNLYDDSIANLDFYRRNYFAINTAISTLNIKYPDSYEVTERYARHKIRSDETPLALQAFKDFCNRDDAPQQAFYAVMDIESYLKHPDSVALYSAKAAKKFPKNSDIYMRRGYALLSLGESHTKVVKAFKAAIKYAPTDSVKSNMVTSLGDYWYQLDRPQSAFTQYRRALRLNPENSMALNNYAYFLSERGENLPKALEMSTKACEIMPSNPTYIDTRAWILYLMGRHSEAKKLMQQAISFDSSADPTLLLHYGDILFAEGERFVAETYWRKALDAGYDAAEIEKRLKSLQDKQ